VVNAVQHLNFAPHVDRRTAIKTGAAALFPGLPGILSGAAPPLSPSSIDHIECWVANAPASAVFYARVFGNQVLKNTRTERRYVRLGDSYIAMDQGQAAHVDHVCAGIPDFKIAAAHEFLTERSIAYRDYPSGRDTAVTEPGGQRLQLAADHGWDLLLTGTAAPETIAVPSNSIFTPLAIEAVLFRTPNLDASAKFFALLLGDPVAEGPERWFRVGSSRIGLLAGQDSGLEYIRIQARHFAAPAALAALSELGASQPRVISANEVEFTDSDNFRFRVVAG
jgi:catechol 2,3-dioxygenase-like lactoylglutathione lyase family enzyme